MPTVRRVIVDVTGSPGSLQALRHAQHLAHDVGATLVPVLAWLPHRGELRRIWPQDAHQEFQGALNLA